MSTLIKFLLLSLLCLLPACQSTNKTNTLVVFVGGLGMNQLGDIQSAVKQRCPNVEVVSAGGWDGYKSNLKSIADANPSKEIVLVGHSFGCDAIAESAPQFKRVDLAVFIEPCWNDIKLPRNIGHYVWFTRTDSDIVRPSAITGGGKSSIVIEGDHNSITHSPQLISGVVDAIKKMKARELTATADKARRPVWLGL